MADDPIPRSLHEPLETLFFGLAIASVAAVCFAGSMAVIWALHVWPSMDDISHFRLEKRIQALEEPKKDESD